ncbi:U3 small nucleolar RNA-associated protein 14 homolog A-like isoform X2 [Odontomachus brunneus]|uniref:U3 small nucleolar RNA-associated protein 14 homolog A-like isoform X2 n=1 Tax=Odontomachus brunneus TaxID=486640 RepID=UPI0013F282D6|nr:U3 small nucleolar RNA-associated protein 14 homolog A-like isoform X2 [Odontomachus brunneus]
MSDLEIAYNSDQEVSENHSKLVEAVTQLDKKQRVNKAERSEPTLEVSEFHLVKRATNKDAVQVRDLVKSLGQKGYQSQITKKLRSIQKCKTISKPLEKPTAEKVKMRFGFERTLKDLSRWNAIVAKNRTATHLTFPLRTPKQKLKIDSPADFINHLRFKSDLQRKLEELDPKLKEPLPQEKEKRDNEEEKSQMTLKDMKKKRSETAKYRAQQSYQEAKAHRQRKIKSKKFHRIERKKRDKEQLVEFEKLQKTDPEKALTMLEQLDKSRAEERMSLRHKSTGQWAKNKQIRAKYDKETRQELAKQLSIGRDLTQKVRLASDNDEDKTSFTFANIVEEPPNNSEMVSEVNDLIESYRKYRDKKKSEGETAAKVDSKSKSPANKLDEDKKSYTKTESEVSEFAKDCLKRRDRKDEESKEESVAKVDSTSKSSVNKLNNISNDMLEKQISEPNKANTIAFAVTSSNQKTKESTKVKKASKKVSTSCTVISDEIVSKKEKAKLCNKKNKIKVKNEHNVELTSTWHVEELQCNKKMDSKTPKVADIDDMFDSVEENIKYKVNLKMHRIKRKLETENKVNKRKKKANKENENYMPNLEFKDYKQKPILDLPLEETACKENSQNTDLTTLKTIMNTEQEPTTKSNSYVGEINLQNPHSMNTKSKHLKTEIPDLDVDEEDVLDNDEQEENFDRFIDEVMENSDAEKEFRKEKEEEIKNSQPETINTSLPGWGSWAGTNIKKSKMRRILKRASELLWVEPLCQRMLTDD